MSGIVLAYITTENVDQAKQIGKALVEKRLAACVNILDGMQSLYWWEGKIEESREAILIAKTESRLMNELIQEVRQLHSYSCPCVLEIPIGGGNPPYLQWLSDNLASKT